MPCFDWYQATVPQPVNDVLECLFDLAPGLEISSRKGMHGYGRTDVLANSFDGQVAQVWSDGSHVHPHVVLSGYWADVGSRLVRAQFPVHSVSRYDVKEDYFDDAFDVVQAKMVQVAVEHRVKVRCAGDHLLTMEGRTTYMGARKSAIGTKLYDKRAEVCAKLPPGALHLLERGEPIMYQGRELAKLPEHWNRLESVIRPVTREAKAMAATLEPVAALGSSAWLRALWLAVEGLQLEPVQVGRGYRVADVGRARAWLLRAGGNVLRGYLEECGSWECVGLQIGQELREMEAEDRMRKGGR